MKTMLTYKTFKFDSYFENACEMQKHSFMRINVRLIAFLFFALFVVQLVSSFKHKYILFKSI